MGSGSKNVTQTSTYEPPPQAKELINLAMPGIRNFAATVPQRYPGSTIADFNPTQETAQEMALQGAQGQAQTVGGAANQIGNYFTDLWNPESNPNLQNAIAGATRPITTHLMEDILPAIRSDFGGANYGSSRRAIAEGQAVRGAETAIGDTSSKLVEDVYNNNLDAGLKAIGLSPSIAQSLNMPAATVGTVGDVQHQMEQALLNEMVGNFNYGQYAPFLQSQDIMSLVGQIPGGTTTSNASMPSTPLWQQLLGGGMAGGSLANMFFPGATAGLGAGLSSLGSGLMSGLGSLAALIPFI
jgi:hypothetical protein